MQSHQDTVTPLYATSYTPNATRKRITNSGISRQHQRVPPNFCMFQVISLILLSSNFSLEEGSFSLLKWDFFFLDWGKLLLREFTTLMCFEDFSQIGWGFLGSRKLSRAGRPTTITEMLSEEPLAIASVRSLLQVLEANSVASMPSSTHSLAILRHSLFSILSQRPSEAIMIKLCSEMEKEVISGSLITTLGLPSHLGSLAQQSPKVLVVESLPGYTRKGPIVCSNMLGPQVIAVVIQIFPPDQRTLFCYSELLGLWSLVIWQTVFPDSLARRALESPRLATQQMSLTIRTTRQQLPALFPVSIHISSTSLNVSFKTCLGFSLHLLLPKKVSCRCSFKKREQLSPPWPSQMPNHLASWSSTTQTLSQFQGLTTPS